VKAAVFDHYGPPEVVHVIEQPDPLPKAGEYLVRVGACGLNHGLDGRTRKGAANRPIVFPHVLGTEITGEVVHAGPDTDVSLVGRLAVVVPWIPCGECDACKRGEDNSCDRRLLRGIDIDGGYCEYVIATKEQLILLATSDRSALIGAAALPISFTTAWHMLHRRARITAADTVLILGAAGTIGIASLQIARLVGARAIAIASTPEKRAAAKRFGADVTIDPSAEDVVARVHEETQGRGADVVVEHVGAATWDASLRCLATNGRLVMCGATSGHDLRFDARTLWRRNISLLFSNSGTTQDLRDVIAAWSSGGLETVIGKVYPLDEVVAAQYALEDRNLIGKIVLNVF
jgi:NADPH:quinone reductase-like Zn-dependent oxidoreductase